MAKQLNLMGNSNVIPTALHLEMQRSYLEYAMSVIVGRALPDVRDGLKPVHRRILYAMHELGLTPDRPYRKCARVVGDVLGKYHPHGDQAVYEAMVRLVQDFSTRYPLLDGHGNFGSVDNDPPAAMRYTETRLSPVGAQALLSEIGEATVDFIDNFDSSQQEPVVLPAQLPILLLNGCSGIAVGMATNIPPHNLVEIVDGLIALIDRPDLADEKLWKLIPGPDFPTGGEIVAAEGIRDAYTTGRGSIPIRGITKLETIQVGRGKRGQRRAIVVSELPYQVHKAAWIEKVAALVNQGRIEGISDIRDESDREGMRVVVELKRDAQPSVVLQQLYKQTPLQTNFGAILLTLVDGQPRQLTLRQLLESFISFREQTLTRQYTYEQSQKERRLHLVDGLLASLNQLDAMIDILRNAPDGTTAKLSLQNQLNLSEIQADAILAMPMRRLTGLEREKLETEREELSQRLEQLQQLLNDRRELLKALKKDLRSLKRKYGDPRRTLINSIASTEEQQEQPIAPQHKSKKSAQPQKTPDTLPNAPTEPEQTLLEFTYQGYIQRQSATTQPKLPKSIKQGEDFVVEAQLSLTTQELMVITASGKAYPVKIRDIPPAAGRKQGIPLVKLLPTSVQSETVVAHFRVPDDLENFTLVLLTHQGKIKRVSVSELTKLTNRGMLLTKFRNEDQLQYANLSTTTATQVVVATSNGRLLRFEINDKQLPIMGRSAQGNQALRLKGKEKLVGCVVLGEEENLLLVSEQGYGKRLPAQAIRLANRGDLGTQALQFKTAKDALVSMVTDSIANEVMVVTSVGGKRLAMESVPIWGKDGTGDPIAQLKAEEKIITVTPLVQELTV
ncbi:MAG: DNA topoisomerase 4 subunit A [Moorea sp. SIO1F2]|uniref:DNA gyrase/topoisomerase IV subunit A n=1 Tax=unclassified Moorena TaxID=2683338 RepID=UPI0013BC8225|nr:MULTISPECIES: DNA topoisomerase (ATP-hydrolyzing) [unclassified Moorena]NEN99195.1 DNA topoisomerase 4 subunit A [Moorena sp. SIO3I7]NEO09296.1 DNA topoisomerase 4 subunit A [Moorena sp. SIO3I8]NET83096.1 DNA topoisomerase 4 subunit A [Moorena sp. SIO1F2]